MPFDPKRPGPNAGDISPWTLAIRAPVPLTPTERRHAKALRKAGKDWPEVATLVGRSEEDVQHGLATVRTSQKNPTRATVNVGIAAMENLKSRGLPHEPLWQTVNRVLGIK